MTNTIKNTVEKMMSDRNFMSMINDLIETSRSAIQFAINKKDDKLKKFNLLCLDFFEALKRSDLGAAISAAQELVQSGHGQMFGLN